MTDGEGERLRTENGALVEEMLARKRAVLSGRSPAPRAASGPAVEQPQTGDPWIDAYLQLRAAWCAGMAPADLVEFARELRLTLPGPPSRPAEIFARMDAAMADAPVDVLLAPGSPLWTPN